MRIAYDNVADVATLAASTTAGSLAASNLQVEDKSQVWRSTGLTASLTATFSVAKTINMVALPFTNLTSTATMRVRGYTNAGDPTPAFDIADASCTGSPYGARADGSGGTLGVNQFAYGGFTHACRWFTGGSVKQVVIDITDSANPSGYVEASRLVMGDYWTPTYNPDYGASLSFVDNTKNDRTDAGSLLSDKGVRYRKMTMNMSLMTTQDRQKMSDILRVSGLSDPLFLSLFPEDADKALEQAHTLYGKLSQSSAIALSQYARYAWSIDVEEV